MSDLRKQLQNAKADYELAKYPGDLAADVFARQATRSRSFWRKVAPYIAAAACVAIVVGWTLFHQIRHVDIAVDHSPTNRQHTTTAAGGQVSKIFDTNNIEIDSTTSGNITAASFPDAEAIPESSTVPSELPLVPSMGSESIPSPPSLASMDFSSDQSSF